MILDLNLAAEMTEESSIYEGWVLVVRERESKAHPGSRESPLTKAASWQAVYWHRLRGRKTG